MPWSIPQKYTCPACGAEFESTANRAPERCPTCRKQHNHRRTAENYRKRRGNEPRVYCSSNGQRRQYHHLTCQECGVVIWTSSNKGDNFVCISCKRALGLTANGRAGSYTTLAAPVQLVTTFGRCPKCKRGSKRRPLRLINDKCEECHWYDIADIDPDMSVNGIKGRAGRKGY